MKSMVAVIGVTLYLMVFSLICAAGVAIKMIPYLFIISPFLMIAMVWTILKDDTKSYPELGTDKEWGYLDKQNNQREQI
ncbi:hypothetical protein [Mucilaginibacter sp.]|uniref:hypothetical protein n=1 Tax=Mucilaginibacter sp. TaxID=1882438 RepID=UPI00356AC485